MAFNVSSNSIESYRIPIVDANDTSCWGTAWEFIDGLIYYGPERYVRLPSTNRNLDPIFEKQVSSNSWTVCVKYLLIPTLIAPAIGAACTAYKYCTLRGRRIRVFNEQRYHVPINNESDIEKGAPVRTLRVPTEKGLSFEEFRLAALEPITHFGDYRADEWRDLVTAYRNYCEVPEEFIFQMLILKRNLKEWRADDAEREPAVNREYFVDREVPEMFSTPIESLIPDRMLPRLLEVRDMAETLENLAAHRLEHVLGKGVTSEGTSELHVHLHSHLTFLGKVNVNMRIAIHDVLVNRSNPAQARIIAAVLKQLSLIDYFPIFLQNLLRSNPHPERAKKLHEVFCEFWDVCDTQVSLSRVKGHKGSLWVYLLAYISNVDLRVVLATLPKASPQDIASKVTDETLSYLAMRRQELPENVKPELLKLLKQIPQTASFVK